MAAADVPTARRLHAEEFQLIDPSGGTATKENYVVVDGNKLGERRYWHTDAYERRAGRWQVVWSQATEIKEP